MNDTAVVSSFLFSFLLKEVDLEIRRGEILEILGPNGPAPTLSSAFSLFPFFFSSFLVRE